MVNIFAPRTVKEGGREGAVGVMVGEKEVEENEGGLRTRGGPSTPHAIKSILGNSMSSSLPFPFLSSLSYLSLFL